MEWGNDDCLRLIDIYRQHPVLWNQRHDYYYNKPKKQHAWVSVARAFGGTTLEVKRKMESLLSSFRRERTKGKKALGTGDKTREVYVSRWYAFKKMSFLLGKGMKARKAKVNGLEPSPVVDAEQTVVESVHGTDDSAWFAVEAVYDPETGPTEEAGYDPEAGAPEETNYDPGIVANGTDVEEPAVVPEPVNNKRSAKTDVFQGSLLPKTGSPFPTTRKAIKRSPSNSEEDPRLSEVLDILKASAANPAAATPGTTKVDDCSTYCEHVANKLREYNKRTKAIVQHHINNILFQADMGDFEKRNTSVPADVQSGSTSQVNYRTNSSDVSLSSSYIFP